jgi:serine/threonine protein kinase
LSEVHVDNSTNTTSRDSLIGKQLGDYRLTSKLASGGMAQVYKGMDYKLQRQAAVKVLEKAKAESEQTLSKRFQREAQAVAALEHENIITIYQFGDTDDVYFLAMRLVKGKDLSAEIARLRKTKKRMDADRAIRIMEQVAAALDYAHAAGIIHRDVKPSNILLDKDDKAILTDFGLVLRSSSETTMGTAFGTPRYIAPEQAVSSNKALPQSDIYSLAVIFYELLTGQTPFNGDSPMEIALSQISDPPPPPRSINPDIPLKAERELLKALEKDPEKRHKTATEFVQAVRESYYKPETGSVTPVKPPSQPRAARPAIEEGVLTLGVSEPVRPAHSQTERQAGKGRGSSALLLALVALAVVIGGAFIVNGMGIGTLPAAAGAPVRLVYDEDSFTMINEGDYTLEVRPLWFIRGVQDGPDDFNAARFPRDILPAGKCFHIILQGRQIIPPPQCQPSSDKRHGQELLIEPRNFHWRAETMDGGRIASFEVRLNGELLARCPTVSRDEMNECHFTWPVVPTPQPG